MQSIPGVWNKLINYRKSFSDLAECKQYEACGYKYEQFYNIEDIRHFRNETILLQIRFVVLAEEDAHILLSETENPSDEDDVLELVLGSFSNSHISFRQKVS